MAESTADDDAVKPNAGLEVLDAIEGNVVLVSNMEPSSPVGAAVAAKAVAIIRDERIVGRADRSSAFAPWIVNEGTDAAMLTTRALTAAAVERMGAAGERMAPYPPDLAVEVDSPNDSTRELAEKIAHDEQVGVPLLWVIRPRRRAVEVRPHTSPPYTRNEGDTRDGGDVVPGVRLPVADISR